MPARTTETPQGSKEINNSGQLWVTGTEAQNIPSETIESIKGDEKPEQEPTIIQIVPPQITSIINERAKDIFEKPTTNSISTTPIETPDQLTSIADTIEDKLRKEVEGKEQVTNIN